MWLHNKKNQQDHEYEFLDLSDVDDNERTRLSSALLPTNDKDAPASLNDDAADAQCRTDDECQFLHNIQSNPSYIVNNSWPHNASYGKLDKNYSIDFLNKKNQSESNEIESKSKTNGFLEMSLIQTLRFARTSWPLIDDQRFSSQTNRDQPFISQ